MYSPVKIHKLSATQKRKLKKGDKVIIKKGEGDEIKLSPDQAKKFERKSKVGAGMTVQLDPYQQMEMSGEGMHTGGMCCTNCGVEIDGGSIIGKIKRAGIGKKLIGFAKEQKLGKRIASAVVERALKTISGSGAEAVEKKKRGRPRKIPTGSGALMVAGSGSGALRPSGY
jgi:hypothetical protein